jgi:signal transduction histidine kinase
VEHVRKSIDDERARTDASLVAERASALGGVAPESQARRRFSDLIEHDRLRVDEQLSRLRDGADRQLASQRLAAPPPGAALAHERDAADEALRFERETADAILEQERRRSDDALHTRDVCDVESAVAREYQREYQKDTDEKLSSERLGMDDTVSGFGEAKRAVQIEEARHHQVVASVMHELNNPLAVIAINAQLLAGGATDTASREIAEDVMRSAARMKRLLADLLDDARIDAGSFRLAPKRYDVGALLSEIRASYTPVFASRQLSFSVDSLPRTPPLLVAFDHDRIVQVLSNLLSNAMKFTPAQGTVNLHVRCHADCVEFVVRDSGRGITKEALPLVFKRFWQAGTESRIGLGLGLYICKTIIAAHGGEIGVESVAGSGASFRFTLPAFTEGSPGE